MLDFAIDRIRSFIQSEAVLVIAAIAALGSMTAFPPTPEHLGAYVEAIDMRTIGLLFCLMTVVAGLYARSANAQTGRYLLWFTVINVALLALFLGMSVVLGQNIR